MGGKKKKAGGKKKGGPDGEEEDVSVDNFMRAYRKKCTELGCEVSKIIREKYDEYCEENEPITKVSLVAFNRQIIVPYMGGNGMVRSPCVYGCATPSQVNNHCLIIRIAINIAAVSDFGRLSARTKAAERYASSWQELKV